MAHHHLQGGFMDGCRQDSVGRCVVATAGWPLPAASRDEFGSGDSLLARYATRLPGVEINTSFYRPHRPATYTRWADSVPPDFRFSVKLPRAITHEQRLVDAEPALDDFMTQVAGLRDKFGCLLVQLPPSLSFDEDRAERFFKALRERHAGAAVLEPRHRTWFDDAGRAMLVRHHIGQVRADPLPCLEARWPTSAERDTSGVVYYRLHGSPRMYYSRYEAAFEKATAQRVQQDARHVDAVWCVYDNTAEGAATANALSTLNLLTHPQDVQNRK